MHPYFIAIADQVLAGRTFARSWQKLSAANNALDTCQRQAALAYPTQSSRHQQARQAHCAPAQEQVRAQVATYSLAKSLLQSARQATEAAHHAEQAETAALSVA